VTKDGRYGKAEMQNRGIIMKLNSNVDKPKDSELIFSCGNLKFMIYFVKNN